MLTCKVNVVDGEFSMTFRKDELAQYANNVFVASASGSAGKPEDSSLPVDTFVYPILTGKSLPKLFIENGKLYQATAGGGKKPFGFVGMNYTQFMLYFGRKESFELIAREVDQLASWGITAVRLPINFALLQPAEGVFPDNPDYEKILKEHNIYTSWFRMVEYFITLAGQRGIYSVFDWHGYPVDPYRHFIGGDIHAKGSGKPGEGIAWLAPTKIAAVEFDITDPRHYKALLATHTWTAMHFKNNTNIMGIEVPYNEPHTRYMNNQSNWAKVTSACALAIKAQDNDRLTFCMPAGWGHDNLSWTVTWQLPVGVDAQAPHHYLANGPVPTRPEAKSTKRPWLCRDQDLTFARAIATLSLPRGAGNVPIYNGEGGEWGSDIFLPDMERGLANDCMFEASLVQGYAAGLIGHMNWICFDNKSYDKTIYKDHGPRFAKVYAEGPVDWSKADVAFIQNPEGVDSDNNHNMSVIPFIDLMLSLHMGPVHYLTDDEIIFKGVSRQSSGLEQVTDASASIGDYKCLIVDKRNLDRRVEKILKKLNIPIFMFEKPEELTTAVAVKLFTDNGVYIDQKTPEGIQLAIGPKHVVVFRRKGESGTDTIYPNVKRDGVFELVDEKGKSCFKGTSEDLRNNGVSITLDKWRSLILEIKN
ncbi:MAG: cellulase family glycosylhydrolase [Planctomycetes bacterium]|nr:cellulase family glycosylhydrolase [Planctomycetota bacterium]